MAQSQSAALPDGIQTSSQLEERIRSVVESSFAELFESKFAELFDNRIKPLIASKNEEAVQAKPEVSQSKAEVEGRVSRGLNFWEQIAAIVVGLSIIVSATWFLGSQLGGLSSDVNGVKEQNKIQFEAMEKLNTERFDNVDKQFNDIKDMLKTIDDRLYNLLQKQTE